MQEITERELEIARLREGEGLSYRAIGERYGITPGRASQLYHSLVRKRQERQWKEFNEAQNQKNVSIDFTLGEIVVLQRILHCYMLEERGKIRHTLNNPDMELLESGVDYITAERLSSRLCAAENQNRERFQEIPPMGGGRNVMEGAVSE